MKRLLNTLYVTTEDAYLSKDGENAVVQRDGAELARFPLHTLENIVCFSYSGASPSLMGYCARSAINLCFMSPRGRFLARAVGENNGNVLLRKKQFRISDSDGESCKIARNMILDKVYNSLWSVERTARDHPMRVDAARLKNSSAQLHRRMSAISGAETLDSLRGLEGEAGNIFRRPGRNDYKQ